MLSTTHMGPNVRWGQLQVEKETSNALLVGSPFKHVNRMHEV